MTAPSASIPQRAPVPLLGYGLAVAGAVLFSAKGILIKLAYAEGVEALPLLALRMGLSTPVFIAVGLWMWRRSAAAGATPISGGDFLKAALIGILGYWFASYADFEGLVRLSAPFERLILFTYPLFVVLLGAVLFGLPFRMRSLVAFGVAYSGLAMIFLNDFKSEGVNVAVGALWVLGSALAFALYQLLAKPMIARIGAPIFTSIALTGAGLATLVHFALLRPFGDLVVSGRVLALSVGLAIGATVMPTYLMNAALSRISASANATIGIFSPVVTLMLAVIFLGEETSWIDLAGTVLVVGGIAWFTLLDRKG